MDYISREKSADNGHLFPRWVCSGRIRNLRLDFGKTGIDGM